MTDALLDTLIYARQANRPFRELTLEDVRSRADELGSAVGWGPTARIAPVARAWRELSTAMAQAGAGTVGELPRAALSELAPRLGVGGSLLA